MNRRSLLVLSTLLGGCFPLRLLAQDPARRPAAKSARTRRDDDEDAPKNSRSRLRDDAPDPAADDLPAAERDDIPPNLPTEPGHQWRNFDISKYTALPHKENNSQASIIDWIFRRTTTAPWHGEKIAVLAAGRTKLRVYHNAKVLDQVAEVVERFVDAHADVLTLRVRVVTTADTRWRYAIYNRLKSIGNGPQGQQVWSVAASDSAMILAQMQLAQGARLHSDELYKMINGQTLKVIVSSRRPYSGGIQRDNAAAQGFQPKAEELEEGVTLRISPLLLMEGDMLDAAIVLSTNNVRTFHQTRVLAAREVGSGEARIDVPEVSETLLNQTVKGWPLGETLLISGGIQPGILQSKGGFLNMKIPGTVPTGTEVLVFVDVELGEAEPPKKADRGRTRR